MIKDNNKNLYNSENMTYDEKVFLIICILYLISENNLKEWETFKNELIYKNRFNVRSKILDEIDKKSHAATITLNKNKILYRARISEDNLNNILYRQFLEHQNFSEDKIQELITTKSYLEKQTAVLLGDLPLYNSNKDELIKQLHKYSKWWKNKSFKGYDKDNSSAPPANVIHSGRANPDYIRYLYLSEDNVTPIYEVRPIIGQTVSVATFKLNKDVKLYDFTKELSDKIKGINLDAPSLYNSIGEIFSKPNNGNENDYLPTQYIAEKIKNMGFDGIRFNSSLNKTGVNIVLFNPQDCEAVSSNLIKTTGIKIETELVDPFKIIDDILD